LVYLDDQLAAVGDLLISAEFYTEKVQDCITLSLQREELVQQTGSSRPIFKHHTSIK